LQDLVWLKEEPCEEDPADEITIEVDGLDSLEETNDSDQSMVFWPSSNSLSVVRKPNHVKYTVSAT